MCRRRRRVDAIIEKLAHRCVTVTMTVTVTVTMSVTVTVTVTISTCVFVLPVATCRRRGLVTSVSSRSFVYLA